MAGAVVPGWKAKARRAAQSHGLDPNVFQRQIGAESSGINYAPNSAGARGIAQFIPSTAASMGIDPMNPDQALNGAAKLMASYVKKYGSYEKALRAYNAGEGAIEKSRQYGETNAYVAKILGGRDPGKLGTPAKGGGKSSGGIRTVVEREPDTTRTITGSKVEFDADGFERQRKQAALRGVLKQQGAMQMLQGLLPETADPTAFQTTVPTSREVTVPGRETVRQVATGGGSSGGGGPGRGGGQIPGVKGKGSGLKELIYNGPNKGYAVKDGQVVDPSVFSAVWAGHANHVHAAAGPKTVRGLGKLAQEMGLHVGANSHFGGNNPAEHVPGSYHNRDMAIDVSAPMTAAGRKKMSQYAARVERIYGLK